jgi:hypothetical protein
VATTGTVSVFGTAGADFLATAAVEHALSAAAEAARTRMRIKRIDRKERIN